MSATATAGLDQSLRSSSLNLTMVTLYCVLRSGRRLTVRDTPPCQRIFYFPLSCKIFRAGTPSNFALTHESACLPKAETFSPSHLTLPRACTIQFIWNLLLLICRFAELFSIDRLTFCWSGNVAASAETKQTNPNGLIAERLSRQCEVISKQTYWTISSGIPSDCFGFCVCVDAKNAAIIRRFYLSLGNGT